MGGPLIVQRPGLHGGAHREGSAGNQHLGGQPRDAAGKHPWIRSNRVQDGFTHPELMRRQHGLGVLLFVLDHHAEGEPGLQQRRTLERDAVQDVQCLGAHLCKVPPGFPGSQQWQ